MKKPKLGPLQQRSEDLLRELLRKPTRGNVTAAIQAAVADTIKAIAEELCPLCADGGRGHELDRLSDDDPDDPEPCAAAEMRDAWATVRPKLWGKLA